MTLDELMAREEPKLKAAHQEKMAREKAEWEAMSPEARKAYLDAIEAKYELMAEASDDDAEPCAGCGELDCDFDCDEEYD